MSLKRFLYLPWVVAIVAMCGIGPAIIGSDTRVVSHRGITLRADGFMAARSAATIMAVIAVVMGIVLAALTATLVLARAD